jgi:hypothetical protein
MDFLFGIVLLVFLVSTYISAKLFLRQAWNAETTEPPRGYWTPERRAKVAASLIVVAAWYIQNSYRHAYSPEARAMLQFGKRSMNLVL